METTVVTGVSSIPLAIFEIVLAVAGHTKIKSALPVAFGLSPAKNICSTAPVKFVITGFPVAQCIIEGLISSVAALDITVITSAPNRINSLATIGAVITATEPVKHKHIVLPLKIVPLVSVISLEG